MKTKSLKSARLNQFLSKFDENNFIDLYYVGVRHACDLKTIESIIFHDRDEAQHLCDYMNEKYNTTMYYVTSTTMFI